MLRLVTVVQTSCVLFVNQDVFITHKNNFLLVKLEIYTSGCSLGFQEKPKPEVTVGGAIFVMLQICGVGNLKNFYSSLGVS